MRTLQVLENCLDQLQTAVLPKALQALSLHQVSSMQDVIRRLLDSLQILLITSNWIHDQIAVVSSEI